MVTTGNDVTLAANIVNFLQFSAIFDGIKSCFIFCYCPLLTIVMFTYVAYRANITIEAEAAAVGSMRKINLSFEH